MNCYTLASGLQVPFFLFCKACHIGCFCFCNHLQPESVTKRVEIFFFFLNRVWGTVYCLYRDLIWYHFDFCGDSLKVIFFILRQLAILDCLFYENSFVCMQVQAIKMVCIREFEIWYVEIAFWCVMGFAKEAISFSL